MFCFLFTLIRVAGRCSGGHRGLGRDGPRVGPAVGEERVDHGGARQGKRIQIAMAKQSFTGVGVQLLAFIFIFIGVRKFPCIGRSVCVQDRAARKHPRRAVLCTVYGSAVSACSVFLAVFLFVCFFQVLLVFPTSVRSCCGYSHQLAARCLPSALLLPSVLWCVQLPLWSQHRAGACS